jgi:two-component system, sensor histidine kinase and response regulator
MQPTPARSGLEALAHMRHAADRKEPFSLVLTDVHMPEMDGFDLVKRIQDTPNLTKAVVLMLTSGEHQGDLARCKELGISAYLTKPVRRSELRAAMITAIASPKQHIEEQAAAKTGVPQEQHRSQRYILLTEDNIVNQRVARRILEKAGHGVVIANNGKEALQLLPDKHPFDLVLMDVQMPEMDGFEATAAIRKSEERTGEHISIIAMTAHAMTGDRERCLNAGMDAYITKPIQASALLDLVMEYSKTPASV